MPYEVKNECIVWFVKQKENESLKAALSADKDVIQLQKLQHLNSQLRDDCDKAKKVWCLLYGTVIIIIRLFKA